LIIQEVVPEATLCAWGNLPSKRTATSTIVDPADEADPEIAIERPLGAADEIDTEGGSVSAKG